MFRRALLILIATQLPAQPADAERLPILEWPESVQRVTSVYDTLWYGGVDSTGLVVPGGVWDFEDGTLQGWTSLDLTDIEPMWRYDAGADTANVLLPQADAVAACWPGGAGYGNYWRQSLIIDGPTSVSFDYETDSETQFDYTYVYVAQRSTGRRLYEVASYTGSAFENTSQSGTFTRTLNFSESLEVLFASDGIVSDAFNSFSGFLNSSGGFRMSGMLPSSGWYTRANVAGSEIAVYPLASLSPQPVTPTFSGHVLIAADPSAPGSHPREQAEVLVSNPIPVPADASDDAGLVLTVDQFSETAPGAAPFKFAYALRRFPWWCPETGGWSQVWSPVEERLGVFQSDEDGTAVVSLASLGGGVLFDLADVESLQVMVSVFSCCDWVDCVDPADCDFTDVNPTPYFDNIRLGFLVPKEVFVDATTPPLDDTGDGRAAAWTDYDGDGDDDVFLANETSGYRLFRNNGAGSFSDMTTNMPAGSARAGIWGDFDDDGDPDLYLVRDGANTMLQNDGGVFSDATSGPLGSTFDGRAAAATDTDGDGDLDIFVANASGTSSRLFQYDGGGWVDATPATIEDEALSAAWGDYDGDGDPDLLTARFGPKVYRNDGAGTFVNVPFSAAAGSVAIWADLDTDGDLDIATGGGGVRGYENEGGDVFTQMTVLSIGSTTSVSSADYDLDGDVDLYALRQAGIPNALIANHGSGEFLYYSKGAVADMSAGLGSAWSDYDADGDPDVYLVNDGVENVLLRSNQEIVPRGATGANHLAVRPITGPGAPAIGARVRIVSGGITQVREISGGAGAGSQDAPMALFGLGASTTVDSVITSWPSGEFDIQTDVPANVPLVVAQPVPRIELGQSNVALDIPFDSRAAFDLSIGNPDVGVPTLTWSAAEVEPCDFVTLSPASGSVEAGNADALKIAIDVVGLGYVELTCDILITTNDPNQSELTVPLTVTTRPVILPAELDTVYALRGSELVVLDTSSGLDVAPIGGTEISSPDMLAISLLGEIYAARELSTHLYRVDGATGASVDLGDLGTSFSGLTFDDLGVLWGATFTGDLHTIDPVSLIPTQVGNAGVPIVDLAFDHVGGRLLSFWASDPSPAVIYEIDRVTAAAQFIVIVDRPLDEIVIDTNGNAFAAEGPGYFSLDLGTGQTNVLGQAGLGLNALVTWPSVTAVDVPAPLPSAYTIIPASPNPFNPRTRIGFTMPEAGRARIDVFDAQGRWMTTLADGVRVAGRHQVVFQADRLGSGVYFYRVELPGLTATRKMTLLK